MGRGWSKLVGGCRAGEEIGGWIGGAEERVTFSPGQSPINLFKMYSMCCVHCVYAFLFCHDHAKIRMWRSEENL